MKLEWVGHACFRMTAENGTVVVTDPYDPGVGIRMIPLEADMITMSHGHHDHCETSMIVGSPLVLRGDETGETGGVRTYAYMSFHDDAQGTKRGPNAVRIYEIDGLRVVHMGDIGCMPAEEIIEAISSADVMMIPVGGFFTVNAQEAKAIIERAKPKCCVPMHVKVPGNNYPIDSVDVFLSVMGVPGLKPQCGARILPDSVPQGVLLLQPEACGL